MELEEVMWWLLKESFNILKNLSKKESLLTQEYLDIDCFVDADFEKLWPRKDKQDPSCVKSRTSIAILIANCPLVWSSKLQTDIATSTMDAEYNSLSMSMKEVLLIRQLLKVFGQGIGLHERCLTSFMTMVWEGNFGGLT